MARTWDDVVADFERHHTKGLGCWDWTGHRSERGYGRCRDESGRYRPATHIAWRIYNGAPVPDGLIVCHRCDFPPCVRPDHLFVGTHRDNSHDAHRKGRHKLGSKQHLIELRRMNGPGAQLPEVVPYERNYALPLIDAPSTRAPGS